MTNKQLSDSFYDHIKSAIVAEDHSTPHYPSKYFKPSSMKCDREMVFSRLGYPTVPTDSYSLIGCAKTGTERHEHIQKALDWATQQGSDWEYMDVETYINLKGIKGLTIKSKRGYETHLIHDELHLSFMCDGVMHYKPTDEYLLFEFKNQASMKTKTYKDNINYNPKDKRSKSKTWQAKTDPDEVHYPQIFTYCLTLGLNKVIMLYEARDFCDLIPPIIVDVSEIDKVKQLDRLKRCEQHAVEGTWPEALEVTNENLKYCKNFCSYRKECLNLERGDPDS